MTRTCQRTWGPRPPLGFRFGCLPLLRPVGRTARLGGGPALRLGPALRMIYASLAHDRVDTGPVYLFHCLSRFRHLVTRDPRVTLS